MKSYFAWIGTWKRNKDVAKRGILIKKLQHDRELAMLEYRKAYFEWDRKKYELPFFKRLFFDTPEPREPLDVIEPPCPAGLDIYIKREQKQGTMEEFLIGTVRHFELLEVPDVPVEFSPQEITLLAQ